MRNTIDTQTETPKRYQCRHIFTDGHRCGSICLRGEAFCYYHHTTRRPVANPQRRRSRRSAFHLPLPEDRSAIQASIGEVLQRISSNEIDPRRAGLLLYGLQIASLNLGKTQPATRTSDERETVETVEEITIDPALGVLAPPAEISKPTERKSSVALMIERMLQQQEASKTTQPHQPDEPATLPTLQATQDTAASDDISVRLRTLINRRNRKRNEHAPRNPIPLQTIRPRGRKQRQRHKTKVQLLPPTQLPKIAPIARK